jgi:hypothetical protein
VNNWGNVTSNKKGFQPLIINGRPVKSINQSILQQSYSVRGKNITAS